MIHEAKGVKITMTDADGVEQDITPLTSVRPTTFDMEKLREMEGAIICFGNALAGAMRGAASAFNDFYKASLFAMHRSGLEAQYRHEFGKLPGSMRTKRLRKKRRDALLRYAYGG